MATVPSGGFHRRELPLPCVALSSSAGKRLFRDALADRGAEGFFRIAEAFRTQDEPAFCGLGTLVTVLNALEVDPGEVWKGTWRWYAESMLGCCVDLEEIKVSGVAFDEWCCIARCQGLSVDALRAEDSSIDGFRRTVAEACASDTAIVCVSYSRGALGQAGDGHYSPIGCFAPRSDEVLIMDVARFKHPPHWVPLPRLWEAMSRKDTTTGRSRGYATLQRSVAGCAAHSAFVLTFGRARLWAAVDYFAESLGSRLAGAASAEEELWLAMRNLPAAVAALVQLRDADCEPGCEPERQALKERIERSQVELAATPVYLALAAANAGPLKKRDGPLPLGVGACTALLLVIVGAVGEEGLRRALPQSAHLLSQLTPPPSRGGGTQEVGQQANQAGRPAALTEDIEAARAALADMISSTTPAHHTCCDEAKDGATDRAEIHEAVGQRSKEHAGHKLLPEQCAVQ